MNMKINKPHIFFLLSLMAVFSCCSSEDYLDINESDIPTAPMTIKVTDDGYVSKSNGASTRASEHGYQTIFTKGDQIGVFAVKNGEIMNEVKNLCFTASSNSTNVESNRDITWRGDRYRGVHYDPEATYYAYYPYQPSLNSELLNTSANTAAEFFANVISKWTPSNDQSTYASFYANDLMIAKGDKDTRNKTLSFPMNHQMALVVIDLPKIKYKFSNSDPAIPDYFIYPDIRFNGFVPYRMPDDTYRYLVNPSVSSDKKFSGSYTFSKSEIKEWKFSVNSLSASSYKFYQIDDAEVTEIPHTLAIGDFYMNDGTLLAKESELNEEQKANCLGIVIKVGRDNSGALIDNGEYKRKGTDIPMNAIHGYVFALYDANGGNICQWGSKGTATNTDGSLDSRFYGYANTHIIKNFALNNKWNLENAFPATYYATDDYETREEGRFSSPISSSGWFLPSIYQWVYICQKKDLLSPSFATITNDDFPNRQYWSSSERGKNRANDAFFLNKNTGSTKLASKDSFYYIRSCLVF